MPTVYFDTAFYVALARADDGSASATIEALNSLKVRTVLSRTLFQELVSSADRPEKDALLCDRLSALVAPSYVTFPNLTWDALRVAGETRRVAADALRSVESTIVEAESASVLANSPFPHGRRASARDHTIAQQPYMQPDGTIDFAVLGDTLRPHLALMGVAVPNPFDEAGLQPLLTMLSSRLGSVDMAAMERKTRLTASVVATDNRPYEVILGTASEKSRGKLAHTYRDAAHMEEFAAHSDAVDLFQLDGPQYELLQRNPDHELRRLGLQSRCFTAQRLDEAVHKVRRLLSPTE